MLGVSPPPTRVGVFCGSPWHPRFIHPLLEFTVDVPLGYHAYEPVLFLELPFLPTEGRHLLAQEILTSQL